MLLKETHDCETPRMVVGRRKFTTGRWFWKENHDWPVYEKREGKWECPECGAKWHWSGSFDGLHQGYWSCISRPEVWIDVAE